MSVPSPKLALQLGACGVEAGRRSDVNVFHLLSGPFLSSVARQAPDGASQFKVRR